MVARQREPIAHTAIKTIVPALGLSEKAAAVYVACVMRGPSSVRAIAEAAGMNRGTTHDLLKELMAEGLISYFHKEKRQYFIAEDPAVLLRLVARHEARLKESKAAVERLVPELRSLHSNATDKPVTLYYEGASGVRGVLQQVIAESAALADKEYVAYSSATIRPHLYTLYPEYTDDRIAAGVTVRVIAIGAGGEVRGLDERKWLSKKESAPTYTLIYAAHIAMVTVGSMGTPRAVVINDANLAATERLIFDKLWERL